jgi:hypothetical protein
MRAQFPLFNTPIDDSHAIWEKILQHKDIAIDATCGNGKDSLRLALLLEKKEGQLFCLDIQEKALNATKELLQKSVPSFYSSIQFILGSHEILPKVSNIKLIVYNLGYLPGADKSITTKTQSTLKSISQALELVSPGGLICITCYPGHSEGKKEEEELTQFLSSLPPKYWSFTMTRWENRKEAPSLILLQKNKEID